MSDQGQYQKGINSDSSGVSGTFITDGTVGGAGTYAVDTATPAVPITVTLPRADMGAGVVITFFGSDANLVGGAVTVAPDATAPADTISGVTTMTAGVNNSQSYISDGVSVWVAFPYAI